MSLINISPTLFCLPLTIVFALQTGACQESKAPQTADTKKAQVESSPISSNSVKKNSSVASNRVKNKMTALPKGTWGGPHLIFTVTESGATLEFECAHGAIDQIVLLDTNGRFDVRGTHETETGGPTRDISVSNEDSSGVSKEAIATGHPARYTGQIKGPIMTLTVTDRANSLGTFTLTSGAMPRLKKCL